MAGRSPSGKKGVLIAIAIVAVLLLLWLLAG
jgi:hypothetical protein